ncbi:MAG: hypothetical protein GY906_16080 [bacterium]|nr:hypothetical protein [bacterium]
MILSKRKKTRARDIARKNWERAKRQDGLSPNTRHRYACRWAQDEIIARRLEFGSNGFSSVVTSIFISLAIRFAMKLITKWLEEEFADEQR